MLKYRRVVCLLVFFLFMTGLAQAASKKKEPVPLPLPVLTKEVKIKSSPSFFGKALGTLPAGTSVTVVTFSEDWALIQAKGLEGWVGKKLLSSPEQPPLKAGTSVAPVAADNDEIAMAGKGFDLTVEKQFQAANKNLNYKAVNAMMAIKITEKKVENFLEAGFKVVQ